MSGMVPDSKCFQSGAQASGMKTLIWESLAEVTAASLRELRKSLIVRRHSPRIKPWGLFKVKE